MMVVSMIQAIIELPGTASIKDKRRIVKSVKQKLINKYKLSVAEIDLHESLTFTQIGGALVSNSRQFGESVLNKAVNFMEDFVPGRLCDIQIHTEFYQ